MATDAGSSSSTASNASTKSKKQKNRRRGGGSDGGSSPASAAAGAGASGVIRAIRRSPKAKLGSAFQFERPTKLLSASVWDVVARPPVNSFKGHYVPSGLSLTKRHRRISVEIHRVLPAIDPSNSASDKQTDDGKKDGKKKDATTKSKDSKAAAQKNKKQSVDAVGGGGGPTTPSRGLLARAVSSARNLTRQSSRQLDVDTQGYEECYVRILVPATTREGRAVRGVGRATVKSVGKVVGGVGRTLTVRRGGGSGDSVSLLDDDDDDSCVPTSSSPAAHGKTASTIDGRRAHGTDILSEIPENATADSSVVAGQKPTPKTEWLEKYRFHLRDISVKKVISNSVVIMTKLDELEQTREIIFDTNAEAESFATLVKENTELEDERGKKRLRSAMGGLSVNGDEMVDLLIEVVSGTDLPAADLLTSDPQVRVLYRGKEIHKTKFIPSTLNPVWTIKTNSLCLLSVTAKELFDCPDGLTFVVEDYDKFGSDEELGAVMIPPRNLYLAKGERVEYALRPLFGKHDYGTGKIAVRVRRASAHDKEFMAKWKDENKPMSNHLLDPKKLDLATQSKGGVGTIKSIVTRNEKVERHGPNEGRKVYRIRPNPDPKRAEETEWMTKEALRQESMKDTYHWLDMGSGKLGRVFLEIIGCDGLPQLDSGGAFGNKTDAFVSIVYEDTIAKTDVVADTLSPRWMPWSQRAFVLNTMHSSSQLFLGVYDYDEGLFDDHDLIGRVSVDLSNFYPGTVYLLEYNIFPTAKTSYMREAMGKITFRLRIEYFDERQMVLSNLEPPPSVYVNVKTRKDWRCARYTTTGFVDMETYSQKTITSYVEEIMTYMEAYYYLEDALVNVLLWRGHFPVKIRIPCKPRSSDEEGKEIEGALDRYTMPHTLRLPLHSINLFLGAIFLVEKPTLIPSFCCAWTAWLLFAVMGYRRHNPNPWNRCKSFGEMLQMLIVGTGTSGPETIEAYENAEAAAEFTKKWEKRLEDAEKLAEKRREQAIKDQEDWEKEMEEIGDTNNDLSTKVGGGPSIDPLKRVLYPIQQYLGITCNCLRFTKNVIIWEECYFSFLISASCLVLAIVFAFVPWAFIVKWSSRLIVWSLFGPWMKLVDTMWYSKLTPLSEEELKEQEARLKREKLERTKAAVEEARLAREDAAKLKDMKKYMFGKFITKVQLLKLDRFKDIPLPASTATPYNQEALPMSELAMQEAGRNRTRVSGQHLVGDMIPMIEAPKISEAPTGQPTGKPGLLEKESPGANIGKDSNFNAATKLGGIVIAAAVLTWFGVPVMISGVKHVFRFSDAHDVMASKLA